MRLSVLKLLSIYLIVLAGQSSVSASPTFSQQCFETEADAKKHKSHYEYREIDNSDVSKKYELAKQFDFQKDVELSAIQSVLGISETTTDEATKLTLHQWTIMFSFSSTASNIEYNSSNGYCLQTRPRSFNTITYTWTPEIYDNTRGTVASYAFHM